ncbi:MAG: aminodeoxychorismate/anthranilate synthase component II [Planctomyces sp.]|nr:aminodeoxychorismate/anthranilate synthase component II [Planctomyces sp.]
MILLIDNYDSFVHNLARYVVELGAETRVVRSDAVSLDDIAALGPRGIILSPGPCTPRQAGVSMDIVRELGPTIPILGVCLGHQAIAEALGGRVVESGRPIHGRTSLIAHEGRGLFEGAPQPLTAARYHSLIVDQGNLPGALRVTARSDDGAIMGLEHRDWPVAGLQFHPESVLTEGGHLLIANFLRRTGGEVRLPQHAERPEPAKPADFFALPVADDAGPLARLP